VGVVFKWALLRKNKKRVQKMRTLCTESGSCIGAPESLKQAGGIISTEAPSSVSVRKSLRFLVFDYWITSKLTDDVHIATKALQSAMFEDVGNTHVKEFRARDLMGTFTSACARNYKSSLLSRTIIRYWCAVW